MIRDVDFDELEIACAEELDRRRESAYKSYAIALMSIDDTIKELNTALSSYKKKIEELTKYRKENRKKQEELVSTKKETCLVKQATNIKQGE